ncbi:hypothetical protein [Flagellimonas eckloniae]|uniref:Sensor of ECF-type sigma factor n=1 Tax=Flagellimonas eckloniae TaxID=346185 RepID=A0A0Q1BW47_9FLAO|nr:hypothetical protein [Allomuricauda eckloniae]KQC28759.1 hypothetical protein AAY42_01770 [Allomuricauda eckloniae]
MNKTLLILFTLLLGSNWIYAQRPSGERIKTLKVAYITERINLTSKEAQSFWPIYNDFEEKKQVLRRKERVELRAQIESIGNLSSEESSSLLDKHLAIQKEKYNLEQNFISKIKNVITHKKTLLLLKAEEDFKKRLIQQYRKHRENK